MEPPAWSLREPATVAALGELTDDGCVDAAGGGPPCATFRRARFLPGGPPPLRRRGKYEWGLPGLGRAEQATARPNLRAHATRYRTLPQSFAARKAAPSEAPAAKRARAALLRASRGRGEWRDVAGTLRASADDLPATL